MKYDYLAPVLFSLAGKEKEICVKVGPSQPSLLGLDVLTAFNADVIISTGNITVNAGDCVDTETVLRNFYQMLSRNELSRDDMVALETLSFPHLAFEKMKNAGKSNLAVNVGLTNSIKFFSFPAT